MKTHSNGFIYSTVAVFLCVAALALFVLLHFFDPSESPIFPPCPTNYATNLLCPGCGTLRALHALVQLDLPRALECNALAVLALPLMPFMLFFPKAFSSLKFSFSALIIVALFTVLRNLSYFDFLAPK